jgi:2-polyprenyl-3-methyl-5-hydroxy-6-metoxy-1,4-benzoquinol methylase
MQTDAYGWTGGIPQSASYINSAIMRLLAENKPRTVLDAGCGNGALCADLLRCGYEVTGVDADANGIELARQQYPGIDFRTAFFAEPALRQFDTVVSTEVVEHLYSPHELADYALRSLKPGGVFIVTTPYHGFIKNLALSLLNKWDFHHTANWHGGHIKFWSKESLSKLLRNAGFEIVGFEGLGRMPYLWMSMALIAKKPE